MKVIDKLPETLVIDRKKWARGERTHTNILLGTDGKMCCLGFLCLACGLSRKEINRRAAPSTLVVEEVCNIVPLMSRDGDHNLTTWDLIEANDSGSLRGKKREEKIAAGFKELGVTVTFIN